MLRVFLAAEMKMADNTVEYKLLLPPFVLSVTVPRTAAMYFYFSGLELLLVTDPSRGTLILKIR